MPKKSKSQKEAEQLISMLPRDVKRVIVAMAEATMDAWNGMDEDDKAKYGDDVCTYLGAQIFLGAKVILEEDD